MATEQEDNAIKALDALGGLETRQTPYLGITEQTSEEAPEEPTEVVNTPEPEVTPEVKESKTQHYAKMQQLEKANWQYQQKIKELETRQTAQPEDPWELLKANGVSEDDIFNRWLSRQENQEPPDEQSQIKTELDNMKKQGQAQLDQLRKAQEQTMLQNEHNKFVQLLNTDKERWELVSAFQNKGSFNDALKTAQQYLEQTGEAPNIDVILDSLESVYEKQIEEQMNHYQSLSKVKKFMPTEEKQIVVDEMKALSDSAPLSPSMSPRGTTSTPAPEKSITAMDRFNNAIRAIAESE